MGDERRIRNVYVAELWDVYLHYVTFTTQAIKQETETRLTRWWALDRMQIHTDHSIVLNMFYTLWPCDIDL